MIAIINIEVLINVYKCAYNTMKLELMFCNCIETTIKLPGNEIIWSEKEKRK